MKRLHLFEIHDQPWCPAIIRNGATDYLQFIISATRPYAPIQSRLRNALERSGARRVVDLCSGAGGPWIATQNSPSDAMEVPVCLTDRFPNLEAWQRAHATSPGKLEYRRDSVDAAKVPPDLTGFRTLFSSFHHFTPEQARALLSDAVRQRQGIAIFEGTQRSALALLSMLLVPVVVLVCTPFIRPFHWARLLLTYAVPVIPFVALFDGVVSCLRTYSPGELRTILRDVPGASYYWEVGEVRRNRASVPVTYLLGYPL